LLKFLKRDRLIRGAQVEQVMGHALLLFGRGFGRADIHFSVELARIDVEDLQLEVLSKLKGERGFATRRRAHQCHHKGRLCVGCGPEFRADLIHRRNDGVRPL